MTEDINLCMGCMSAKDYEGECKFCGYSDKSPYLPSYLAPKTLLNDRYIVGKILKYNGEGALYVAFDKVTKTKVTIKEYMPDALCSRKKDAEVIYVAQNQMPLYKTYMSEFVELNKSIMKSRGMSHIQTVLDIFPQNNTAYIVFEHIEGITLKTFLSNCAGELSWEQVKNLFPPILTTLSLVHSVGITHRGISPETIMVTDKMQLKLIDFEISAARTTNTEIACEMYGGFSAPEQHSTTEWHGSWTDVYGISATLYRVLTGCVPTEAISRRGNDSLVEPMLINRNVPANVSKVIVNGMKLSTSERIQTITDFVDKLFEQPRFNGVEQNQQRTAPTTQKNNINAVNNKISETKKVSTGKKKKGTTSNQKAAMITIIASLVIIMAFMVAIFVLPMMDNDEDTNNSSIIDNTLSTEGTENITSTTAIATTTKPGLMSDIESSVIETLYVIPDFKNRLYTSIKDNEKYSYLTIEVTYKYNNDYSAGMVYAQDVPQGNEVISGTKITLTVSKGPSEVALPDYSGKNLDEYIEILKKANIKFEKKTIESDKVDVGYVVKCSVDVGKKVNIEKGETVTVYYAVKKP